jgi:hypothetical protein
VCDSPTAKHLPLDGWRARFRLDRLECLSVTFTCAQCKQRETVSVAELIKRLGPDRNVATIGNEVLKCGDKRTRREGYDCPITQVKKAAN